MKSSIGISNFLEEVSSLHHSIAFLYFFALIPEEGFLISPCYYLELCIQMGISFCFCLFVCFLPLASLLFSTICKASSDNPFSFCIFFSWSLSWSLSPLQCHELSRIHSSSSTLSDLIPWIYLSLPLYNRKGLSEVTPEWSSDFPYFLQFKS